MDKKAYRKTTLVISIPLAALACYLLNSSLACGSVLSTGLIGTTASFLPLLNKESPYLKELPSAIYCGAFVGMTSIEIAPFISFVIVAGSLAAVFYFLSKNLFVGYGGKLGTIAFIGVVIVKILNWI